MLLLLLLLLLQQWRFPFPKRQFQEVDPGKWLFTRLAALVPDLATEQESMANAATHLEKLAWREGYLSDDMNFMDHQKT